MKTSETITTDVLVIGGGGAGIRAAIEARKYDVDVLLVSESPVGYKNNTAIAHWIYASSGVARGIEDLPEAHLRDTIVTGCYINDRSLVKIMTDRAPQQLADLLEFGVKLKRRGAELQIQHDPGHSCPRGLVGEGRGVGLTRPLREYAAKVGVRFTEGVLVTRLLKTGNIVSGAIGLDNRGQALIFSARSIILAAGGAGDIYLRNDNAFGSTGDGYVLAYDAGVPLRDMEFVQFYPTSLGRYGKKNCNYARLLKSGAKVRNSLGEDIQDKYNIRGFTYATRDVLSRAMMTEIVEGRDVDGSVILDCAGLSEEEFENTVSLKIGLSPSRTVRIAPSAHFFMGGVEINANCETGLDGLFAAGEVCGGIHGANRLGGNAITELLVFGAIAGDRAASRVLKLRRPDLPERKIATELQNLTEAKARSGFESLEELRGLIQRLMWDKAGILRSGNGLEGALGEISSLREQSRRLPYGDSIQAVKLTNMLTVSEMVCRAALARKESRGAHYRTDYPGPDDSNWLKTIEITSAENRMVLRHKPLDIISNGVCV